jgi:hypothetical protein
MISGDKTSTAKRLRLTAAASLLLLFGVAAAAQDSKPAHEPGLLDRLGIWLQDSVDAARDKLGGVSGHASGAAKEAAEAAREAADAAAAAAKKFPNSKLVDGRVRCEVSANGAPDCKKAVETVCKAKGFTSGSSVEIQSAQNCSARAWIQGKQQAAGDCEMQTFVTRAMCQ